MNKIPYKRINIFTGNFGSGKTEVAVNFAFHLKNMGLSTTIADLDIVNPFFRTKDAEDSLKNVGINVIASIYANTNVDVPAVNPGVYGMLENNDAYAVLDIGGDDLGAKAIARFKEEILKNYYEIFFVVNAFRPFTDTVEKMENMLWEIENSSGLKVTNIVNNSNLMHLTTQEDLLNGRKMVEEFSNKCNIPIAFETYMKNQKLTDQKYPVLTMEKFLKAI